MIPLIIDTDIGDDIDDAIALAFALRRPELDVRAITTVFGPTDVRARMVAKLLRVMGRQDVPFAPGLSKPLGRLSTAQRERLARWSPNQAPFVRPDEDLPPPACKRAETLLARAIEAAPGEVWLATIGPMTNAGAFVRRRPDLAAKLKGIVSMAGETRLNRKEWNILCDPVAARMVLRSGLVRFLGTWSVTRRVVLEQPELDALRRADTPLCRALLEMIGLWMPHRGDKPGPVLYDMCPLVWLFAPQFFRTDRAAVDVELKGPLTRGMTIPVREGPPLEVSADVEEKALLGLLMETLTAASPPPPLERKP